MDGSWYGGELCGGRGIGRHGGHGGEQGFLDELPWCGRVVGLEEVGREGGGNGYDSGNMVRNLQV